MPDALGISADAERVYESLIGPDPVTIGELCVRSELTQTQVRTAVRTLVSAGLARRREHSPASYVAVDPGASAARLLREREAELVRAHEWVQDLSERFQVAASDQDPSHLIEVITGAEAITQRVNQVERSAQRELRVLDRPPYHSGPVVDEGEMDLLRRGCRVRAIYARASLEMPGRLDDIRRSAEAGEEARVLPDLPAKLALADDSLAVLPLRAGFGLSPSFVVIRRSALLEALAGLFEALWLVAIPISASSGADVDPGRLAPLEAQLLTLLTAGMPDEAIARHLGLSYRTLQRRVRGLMDVAGAATRFQLGIQAERRGWIGTGAAGG